MDQHPINFTEKFSLITEQWAPRIIAQMDNYHFKIAKIQGEFIWHSHPKTDETFIVLQGMMQIQFREGIVNLKTGEMFIIPKGIEHKPVAEEECHILMIELAGTLNTGDAGRQRTIEDATWI